MYFFLQISKKKKKKKRRRRRKDWHCWLKVVFELLLKSNVKTSASFVVRRHYHKATNICKSIIIKF
jgi:hypothetical protein